MPQKTTQSKPARRQYRNFKIYTMTDWEAFNRICHDHATTCTRVLNGFIRRTARAGYVEEVDK